jgi:UPF0755 protein
MTDQPPSDILDPAPQEEYEELRPEASRGRKVLVGFTGVVVVLALFAGATGFWAYRQLHPGGRGGTEIVVDIPTGSSTASIADLLARKGVIGNAFVFKTWLKLKGSDSFKAGQYKLRVNADADDVRRALEAGPLPPPSRQFTVLPGVTVREVPAQVVKAIPSFSTDVLAQLIASNQAQAALEPPGKGLEGFLFPDTYQVAEGADEAAVLKVMVTQFDKVAAAVGLDQAQTKVGLDPYSVLIVASLVEKEAKVDTDRSKIARVIYNRLASGTPLGVDASLCYLKDEKPCVLRQSDLAAASPYNTRKNVGLPPTPISNVSQKSLEAALSPAAGDWIYYVLDPNLPAGEHLFTSSASEFAAAKARCKAAGLGCD